MDKNFTPEQIDMINRIVFAHLDQMKQKRLKLLKKQKEQHTSSSRTAGSI